MLYTQGVMEARWYISVGSYQPHHNRIIAFKAYRCPIK